MDRIRAHFDGKNFVPDEPVALPVGERVEVGVPRKPKKVAKVKLRPDGRPVLPTNAVYADELKLGKPKKLTKQAKERLRRFRSIKPLEGPPLPADFVFRREDLYNDRA